MSRDPNARKATKVEVIHSTETLTRALAAIRGIEPPAAGSSITDATVGLVPTMGALHAGHLSLVAAARRDCQTVVLSAFVNPKQFVPGEDLAHYPRDPEGDKAQAAAAGVDILFAPSTAEIFPPGLEPDQGPAVGGVGDRWEAVSRPGHFEGVVRVVSRLFEIVGPCRAYFGEKDYQQLLVVRRLVAARGIPVEVVGRPTVRDPDGLALSSRNARLDPDERRAARVVPQSLLAGRAAIEAGERDSGAVQATIEATIKAEPRARLDYAAVTDPITLAPAPTPLAGGLRLLVAARLGPVRLIDNLAAHAG